MKEPTVWQAKHPWPTITIGVAMIGRGCRSAMVTGFFPSLDEQHFVFLFFGRDTNFQILGA